jgi:hypothetical protein
MDSGSDWVTEKTPPAKPYTCDHRGLEGIVIPGFQTGALIDLFTRLAHKSTHGRDP